MLNEQREKTLNDLLLLERSIIKWENIAYNEASDESIDDCALCKEYYSKPSYGACEGCPIKALSGKPKCALTPYTPWISYFENKEYDIEDDESIVVFDETSKQLAIDMIVYLKTLSINLKLEILSEPEFIGFDPGKGDTSVSHGIQ